ncbi:tRNA(Ile)-lysidine synthase [Methanoregula sp.]|uniref:tRNA(Ile)-lysidine synthase n=1 Tax=Methanoregula sp. TaxID=2052170 RepID=UPI002C81638E|nr:tRNA(Ile)-lysidine synthase [Methanoregula sp.]HVP95607.1 tRNA(Ile)-lysidine synthase [Methanoregula sp.]
MQCDACRREATVFQPYSGKHLCPLHFTRDLEAKAKRIIRSHGWLRPGDHIAVVLFGDAASAGLLFFLASLTRDRRDIRISAITIDPGISGYPVRERAQEIADSLGVPCFSGSLAERYGITMDRLVAEEGQDPAGAACSVLAGDFFGEIAAEQGVTRCAFATTVDETAAGFFSDLLAGIPEHTLFSRQVLGRPGIPVIRPFTEIPASEVLRYAELHVPLPGPGGFLPQCPGTGNSGPGNDEGEALDSYSIRHPATKFALANLAGTLAGIAAAFPPAPCPVCGEPLEAGKCPACAIRKKYGRNLR